MTSTPRTPAPPTTSTCEAVVVIYDDRFPSWVRCELREEDHGDEHEAKLRSTVPTAYLVWTSPTVNGAA